MTNQQAKQILRYLSNNEQVFINAAYEGMSVVDLISKVSQDMPTPEREMKVVSNDFVRELLHKEFDKYIGVLGFHELSRKISEYCKEHNISSAGYMSHVYARYFWNPSSNATDSVTDTSRIINFKDPLNSPLG